MTDSKDETIQPNNENSDAENIQENDVDSGMSSSSDEEKSNVSESKIIKFLKSIFPTVVIGIGSFLLLSSNGSVKSTKPSESGNEEFDSTPEAGPRSFSLKSYSFNSRELNAPK